MNTDPYMSTDQRSYSQKLADRITDLERENSELRAKLGPQRQKIWVLVQRSSLGDLTADVFTDPNDPIIEILKLEAGPNNYVEIHASI